MGKVTFKSTDNEALSNESLLKSNSGEALNDDFPEKVTAMKPLMLGNNL